MSISQFDDFEDETTVGWEGNVNGIVTNISTGGPTGGGDAFLLTAVTNFPFHLGAKNEAQWTGDYLAERIGAIEMDLNHFSPASSPMRVRIVIFGPGGVFASTVRTLPLATNQWTHHVFGLTTNDLQYVTPLNCGPPPLPPGTGVLADTLAGVTGIIIRHDKELPTSPKCHPPHVTAIVGIDNIRAVPRRPIIEGFAYDGTSAVVNIADLVVGFSNVVQTANQFSPDAWSDAAGFTAATEATNMTLSTTQTFFRIRIPKSDLRHPMAPPEDPDAGLRQNRPTAPSSALLKSLQTVGRRPAATPPRCSKDAGDRARTTRCPRWRVMR